MAYDDLFGDINNCMAVAPAGVIRLNAAAGTNPNVLLAVGAQQVAITIFDAYIIPTATVALGTVTVETDIAGAGDVALTDAMVCAVTGTVAHATTLDPAQATIGPADALQANKNAAADAALLHLLFFLV